jgi:hypothetical protein
VSPRLRDIRSGGTEEGGDPDVELRTAISIYLIAERPDGATLGEIARLGLGGETPIVEVPRVSRAVMRLRREGEVTMEGEKVCPAITE